MKKYLAILSSILLITSCDIVDGPYITDSESYVNPDKKVLIEDFTGHRCPNCPGAARELEEIHNVYGDQIIGMAIHVSAFAKPNHPSQEGYQYDFRTEWGNNWDAIYEISNNGLPAGMVNRVGYQENSHRLGESEWAAIVANELQKDIDFIISIDADTNTILISSTLEKTVTNNFYLVVCLTESNIINWQEDSDDPLLSVPNYEHNHVLRTVIYDGILSNESNFENGLIIENNFEISLYQLEQYNINYSNNAASGNGNAGGWNPSNMHVIAYIYNTNTKEIVQVEEVSLNN